MSNSNLNNEPEDILNLNLRDRFALRILPTIWDKGHRIEDCESFSDVASLSYRMADLMLRAREGSLIYPGTEVITLEGEDGGHVEVRLDLNDKGSFEAINESGEDVDLTEEEIQEVFAVSSFNNSQPSSGPKNDSPKDDIADTYERDL